MLNRALYCLALLPLTACTRDNPAFDDLVGDASTASEDEDEDGDGDDDDDDDGDGDGDGDDTNGDGDSDTDTSPDLPDDPLLCSFQANHAPELRFSNNAADQASCANNDTQFHGRIIEAGGSTVLLKQCSPGCPDESCTGAEFLLDTGPMLLAAQHLPGANEEGACLRVETQELVKTDGGTCFWQAISVFSSTSDVPYIIAATGNGEPTPSGQEIHAELIPEPVQSGVCSCSTVPEANDGCCEQAEGGAAFYYYPWTEPAKLYPGATGSLVVPQLTDSYLFKVFQAQQLNSCNAPDFETAWAVLADL